jgi:hypothetical protein
MVTMVPGGPEAGVVLVICGVTLVVILPIVLSPVLTAVLVRDREEFWLGEEFWGAWHPEVFAVPEVFMITSR